MHTVILKENSIKEKLLLNQSIFKAITDLTADENVSLPMFGSSLREIGFIPRTVCGLRDAEWFFWNDTVPRPCSLAPVMYILLQLREDNFPQMAQALTLVLKKMPHPIELKNEIYIFFKNYPNLADSEIVSSFLDYTIRTTKNIESLKFSLMLFEYMDDSNITDDELEKLGACEELTLYILFLLKKRDETNSIIFSLAQKLHGWGKIHAVRFLRPETEAIQKWFRTEGFKNDILERVNLLECIFKGDLQQKLGDQNLSEEEYYAAARLLTLLILGGPNENIDDLEEAQVLVERFLYQTDLQRVRYCNFREPETLCMIRKWFTNQNKS